MSHSDANRERLVAMVVVDSQVDPFDLDALAVSDRFRLFGFTRRDDYLAYLWVQVPVTAADALSSPDAGSHELTQAAAALASWVLPPHLPPSDLRGEGWVATSRLASGSALY